MVVKVLFNDNGAQEEATKLNKEFSKISDAIDSAIVYNSPTSTDKHDDGKVTHTYDNEHIEVDGVAYSYSIKWTGYDDGEDGGTWSEPYNIMKE